MLPRLVRFLLVLALALPAGLFGQGAQLMLASAGDLDPSFDDDGIVVASLETVSDLAALTVAVQPDGKIVVAANGRAPDTDRKGFAVARFLPDGRRDLSFGSGGTVLTDVGAGDAYLRALAVQPDGKIVAGGVAKAPNSSNDLVDVFALVRYTTDGRLDTGFGSGGMVVAEAGPTTNRLDALGVQADGRIVAAGTGAHCGGQCLNFVLLARYHPDGRPDVEFGGDGQASASLQVSVVRMVLQADGKIVVRPNFTDVALARFTSAGDLDPSFGTNGIVTGSDLWGYHRADLALQADGKFVVVGQPLFAGIRTLLLLRYTSSGSLDPTFGTGGRAAIYIGQPGYVPNASAVVVQADGNVVVAGINGSGGLVLGRYTPTGSYDTSFGINGQVITTSPVGTFGSTNPGNVTDIARLALQPDGKLVAASTFIASVPSAGPLVAVARYQTVPDSGVGGKDFRIGSDRSIKSFVTLNWGDGTDEAGYLLARTPTATWLLPPDAGGYTDTSLSLGPDLNCYQVFALGTSAILAASDALCVRIALENPTLNRLHFSLWLSQSATAHLAWTVNSGHLGYVLLALPQDGAPRAQVLAPSVTAVDDPTNGVPTCYVLYVVYESELDHTNLTCALPGRSAFGAASPASQRARADGPQASARSAAESLTGRAATVRQDLTTRLPAGQVKVQEAAAQLRTKQRPRPPRLDR